MLWIKGEVKSKVKGNSGSVSVSRMGGQYNLKYGLKVVLIKKITSE